MFSLVFFFVLIFFFSPFSIVIVSLGEERAGICASCASVYFTRVNHCPFYLPLDVRGWLRLVTVALPGLLYYLLFMLYRFHKTKTRIRIHKVFILKYLKPVKKPLQIFNSYFKEFDKFISK